MIIENNEIIDITNKFDTPLYYYDGNHLRQHFNRMKENLHKSIDIFFSMKSNSNVSIAGLFCLWGSGIEVASIGELKLALAAGFKADNIIFSGPGKKREELEFAIQTNIYCIIVESIDELILISKISTKIKDSKVNIGIRVNPEESPTTAKIKMGGVPRQFGIDESQLDKALKLIKKHSSLKFRGIHIYIGTQILDIDSIINSFQYTINLAKYIKEHYKLYCEMIDLGGGFGVPYFPGENELNFNKLSNQINQLIEKSVHDFPKTRFIIESGRYLLAESGVYLVSVLHTKYSKGEKFVITDGGLHHHQAATFRGRRMRSNYPICVIKREKSEDIVYEKVNIVGSLCTTEDCLGKNVQLPKVEEGDIICISKSGAYGLSYSPNHFLGHRTPLELLKSNNEYFIIRKRGEDKDLILNQNIINWKDELKIAINKLD